MKQPFDRAIVRGYLVDKLAKTRFEHSFVYPIAAGLLAWLVALGMFVVAKNHHPSLTVDSTLGNLLLALGVGAMVFAGYRYNAKVKCPNCAKPMQKFSDSNLETDENYVWVFVCHACKRYFVWRSKGYG